MAPLEGVHRVRIKLASGFAEYWYAWRGGPKILSVNATTERLRDIKVRAAAAEAAQLYHQEIASRRAPLKGFVHGLVTQWQGSDEFAALARRTQSDYRKHLAVVRDGTEIYHGDRPVKVRGLGDMPLRALSATGARKVLLDWRKPFAHTPKTADSYLGALDRALKWGRDNGLTDADPLDEFPRLYRVDRSDIVWTAKEIEAVCAAAAGEPELQRAILLAAYSGLRKGDVLVLPWSAIGKDVIIRRTAKRRRVVDIPITDTLREILAACPRVGPVILSKDGRPWKESTLDKRWNLARAAASERMPSIAGKRWHDLRGTFATQLARSGVDDDKIDQIMGWKKGNSAQTRAAYVSGQVVAHRAIAQLKLAA